MSESERIGLYIIKVRRKLGMNQSEFAKSIGMSRTGLYLYESGKRLISTEALLKIYEKYNISPNEVLGIVKD